MQPQSITSATYTVTPENNTGAVVLLSRAAGITVTLPAALGYGSVFEFLVNTTVTSNSDIIKVANSTDVMTGVCVAAQDGGDTVVAFETAASSDTITLNGTTTGGIKGDRIILKDVAAGLWSVNIVMSGTGTEATPFSATV
jgi:hypothetical protein